MAQNIYFLWVLVFSISCKSIGSSPTEDKGVHSKEAVHKLDFESQNCQRIEENICQGDVSLNKKPVDELAIFISPHLDDWQLFMGEKAYSFLSSNIESIFIYITAGDAGKDELYWKTRERGAMASIHAVLGDNGQTVERYQDILSKNGNRKIYYRKYKNTHSYFLRLPDGEMDGRGTKRFKNQSLLKLRKGELENITSIDQENPSNFTSSDISEAVNAIILIHLGEKNPHIFAIDAGSSLKDTHSDHYATSLYARDVAQKLKNPKCRGTVYGDYRIKYRPVNLSDGAHKEKELLFLEYDKIMASVNDVNRHSPDYQAWLRRSYYKETSCCSLIEYRLTMDISDL